MWLLLIALAAAPPTSALKEAIARLTPKKVHVEKLVEVGEVVVATGFASSHEDVADYAREVSSIAWTPKGFGRVVEQTKTIARVELAEGSRQNFMVHDVRRVHVALRKADSQNGKAARVTFELEAK